MQQIVNRLILSRVFCCGSSRFFLPIICTNQRLMLFTYSPYYSLAIHAFQS